MTTPNYKSIQFSLTIFLTNCTIFAVFIVFRWQWWSRSLFPGCARCSARSPRPRQPRLSPAPSGHLSLPPSFPETRILWWSVEPSPWAGDQVRQTHPFNCSFNTSHKLVVWCWYESSLRCVTCVMSCLRQLVKLCEWSDRTEILRCFRDSVTSNCPDQLFVYDSLYFFI